MSLPGWYPDPAGTPDRFRYWDGRAWSHEVTDDPAGAPPPTNPSGGVPPGGGPPDGGGGTGGRRSRTGPVILALAAVIVLVLVGILVVRGLLGSAPVVDPGPLPTSSQSGWDDRSPTPTPTPTRPSPTPTPTPTATPSPTPSASDELPVQPCPVGQPTARQDHPQDGRVHGGGLSFPRQPRWDDSPGVSFSWAYDVGEQMTLVEEPDWYANLAVGALFTGDGFDEPRRAAELVMQCVITSGLYPFFTQRVDTWSKSVTVDGRPAWSIRADVDIDDPELDATGDTVEVIVVDTGSPESLAMFIGAVTIDDQPLLRTLDRTIADLRVD